MQLSKQELRKRLRAARHGVSPEQQAAAAEDLCNNVYALPFFEQTKNLALYWPADNEINTLPLLNRCLKESKYCFLPVLCLGTRQSLSFANYTPETPVIRNRYDIIEPDLSFAPTIQLFDLDIIFVPLVGFDRSGYRLGRGGGCYDATFAELPKLDSKKLPKLVGLGYDLQQVDALPLDSWDWRLDAVITESHVYEYSPVSK